MSFSGRIKFAMFTALIASVTLYGQEVMRLGLFTQQPVNNAPNPYRTIENHFKMPEGRTWGSTSAVEVDRDGKSIWVSERCGQNRCADAAGEMSKLPSILKFDESGKLVASFGEGSMIFPHGITVDREGNVWVTDGQDNAPQAQRGVGGGGGERGAGAAERGGGGAGGGGGRGGAEGQRGGAPAAAAQLVVPRPGATKGHQVFKYSPDGKLLMTLGKPAGGVGEDYFYQPNDVLVAPNGDIFVAEGHSDAANANARILKFNKDGKLIKTFGKRGNGPGELLQPHALAMDSRGRLFVGDRSNNRISIFDQEGNFLEMWYQFGRPSGVAIDRNDNIYVADSESGSVNPANGAWKRGIRIGSARDGKVTGFIPDPDVNARGTSAAEGVAVDAQGNIYGAEVGPRALKKYVKR